MRHEPSSSCGAPGRVLARAHLLAKREVTPHHFELRLWCPEVARRAGAGQFVHVLPHAQEGEDATAWSYDPLLRRAFSVMDVCGDEFEILFRVEGRGTARLAQALEEAWLDLIGPLGSGFSLLVPPRSTALLIGGGVGVPPLVLAARCLQLHGVPTEAFIGARSASDVLCVERFRALGVPVRIATDDGSRGLHGRVDALLSMFLEANTQATVFACGPYPMLRAIAALCEAKGVGCEVSLEENMPCGIGVCNGCVVPVRETAEQLVGDDYGRYRRICVHGPACDAREIAWS